VKGFVNGIKHAVKSVMPTKYHPLEVYKRDLKAKAAGKVLGGPFRGMTQALPMCDETGPGEDLLVVLGVYERELHSAVEEACALNPRLVVIAGGYRGYYAAGFGMRLPNAAVVVYEMQPEHHRHIRVNAEQNGLKQFQILGHCGIEELNKCLAGHVAGSVLIVCDIEGAERTLMDPSAVPGLRNAAIIVELHGKDMRDLITSRFAASHDLTYIPVRPHGPEDFPDRPWYLALSDPTPLLAERPLEHAVGWLWMKPKGCAGTADRPGGMPSA
jgi:hypothetical protein